MSINKNHVKRQFERSAMQYDSVASMQRKIIDVLAAKLPALAEPSEAKVCDLGCGTGDGLLRLLAAYPKAKLTGLDLAPAMLQTAELKLKVIEERGQAIEFLQGDIEALPFEPHSMDVCFSSSAIQWCDATVAVRQISNTLKPGGSALISSFLRGTLQSWRELWGQNSQSFLSLEEFKAAFSGSGLVLERVWSEPYVQSFDSFNSALASIRHLGAGNASSKRSKGLMGRERLKQIIKQVDTNIQHHGSIDLRYQVVYAKASKLEATDG